MSAHLILDMVEHINNVQVVEIIRVGDHLQKHGYDCCHPDSSEPVKGVFKCYDCGLVAETTPKEWMEGSTNTLFL